MISFWIAIPGLFVAFVCGWIVGWNRGLDYCGASRQDRTY